MIGLYKISEESEDEELETSRRIRRDHDVIHRGLKSQTPADVHLLNRRTSAGELCRIVKLLTCLLGEGDKFSNQFDSYPSTRIR